jgi:serine kinase of HPr protein (carbohydrate metabolism regulator)
MALSAVIIHATAIRLGKAGAAFGAPPGLGVLLLGPSGAGKSDLALRLIAAGAVLVADDRTELYVQRRALFARPPARIAGLLEVRGVGILAVPHAPRVRIGLAVDLAGTVRRLPETRFFRAPAALRPHLDALPPVISLRAGEPSAPAKVAIAAAAFAKGLHREDINPI